MQCQCDYNVSIRVLQQYVKTQHPGKFTTSDLYYNRFSHLGKPSVYHTPRRPQLQFYDVIFSLVIIGLLRHWFYISQQREENHIWTFPGSSRSTQKQTGQESIFACSFLLTLLRNRFLQRSSRVWLFNDVIATKTVSVGRSLASSFISAVD